MSAWSLAAAHISSVPARGRHGAPARTTTNAGFNAGAWHRRPAHAHTRAAMEQRAPVGGLSCSVARTVSQPARPSRARTAPRFLQRNLEGVQELDDVEMALRRGLLERRVARVHGPEFHVDVGATPTQELDEVEVPVACCVHQRGVACTRTAPCTRVGRHDRVNPKSTPKGALSSGRQPVASKCACGSMSPS